MKNWNNIKGFLLTFPSFILFLIILVWYYNSKLIIRSKYQETNNYLYLFLSLFLSFILIFLFRHLRGYILFF
jgi:hypothetical protein